MVNEPTTGLDAESRLEEAIVSFEQARDKGANPDPRDWLARYADVGERLAAFFADGARIAGVAAPLRSPAAPREKLPEIEDYEILDDNLPPGGMGVVYKARQRSARRIVALKVIRTDRLEALSPRQRQQAVERFVAEAQAAAQLEHDHIVKVYHVGEDGGRPFYAMRFVEGPALAALIETGPVDARRAARYIEQVARGVHEAHRHGILHRDIKPQNILVDTETDRALVTDFGLAKLIQDDQGLTRTGDIMGTPPYMPPEQAQSADKGTVASDVYSLGATLYALLTGRPPFKADTPVATLKKVLEEDPVPPRKLQPAMPRDLETICLKCLEKNPRKRYASAEELADRLRL